MTFGLVINLQIWHQKHNCWKKTLINYTLLKLKNAIWKTIKRIREKFTYWEKIFVKYTYDKEIICKIHKESLKQAIQLQNGKKKNPLPIMIEHNSQLIKFGLCMVTFLQRLEYGKHYLICMIKVNINSNSVYPWYNVIRICSSSVVFLSKTHNQNLNMRKNIREI